MSGTLSGLPRVPGAGGAAAGSCRASPRLAAPVTSKKAAMRIGGRTGEVLLRRLVAQLSHRPSIPAKVAGVEQTGWRVSRNHVVSEKRGRLITGPSPSSRILCPPVRQQARGASFLLISL